MVLSTRRATPKPAAQVAVFRDASSGLQLLSAMTGLSRSLRSHQFIQQLLCGPEIRKSETFGETAVRSGEHVMRLGTPPEPEKQASKAHGGPQLPRRRPLPTRPLQGAVEMVFCSRRIGAALQENNFAFDPKRLGHPPEGVAALSALHGLGSGGEGIDGITRRSKNLSQYGQEGRVDVPVLGVTQRADAGAEHPRPRGDIAASSIQLPFVPKTQRVIAAEAVLFGEVLNLGDRAFGGRQVPEPQWNAASTPQ